MASLTQKLLVDTGSKRTRSPAAVRSRIDWSRPKCKECGRLLNKQRAEVGVCGQCVSRVSRCAECGQWNYRGNRCKHAWKPRPKTYKDCVSCGNRFHAKHLKQKFCSKKCGRVRRRKYECSVCGVLFTAGRIQNARKCNGCKGKSRCHRCGVIRDYVSNKHCDSCRANAKERRKQAYTPVRRQLNCIVCGRVFVRCGPGQRKTCSEKCSRLRNKATNKAAKVRRKLGARVVSFVAADVFKRDGYRCGICGKKTHRTKQVPDPWAPTLDHIVPLSNGGEHTLDNVQCAHFACNCEKSNRKKGQKRLFG